MNVGSGAIFWMTIGAEPSSEGILLRISEGQEPYVECSTCGILHVKMLIFIMQISYSLGCSLL